MNIWCIDEVDEEVLFIYDSYVFGYLCYVFLMKWFCVFGCYVYVVIDVDGLVEGYVVVRLIYVKEDGFRIGLLFVDFELIVEKLLMVLFKGFFL